MTIRRKQQLKKARMYGGKLPSEWRREALDYCRYHGLVNWSATGIRNPELAEKMRKHKLAMQKEASGAFIAAKRVRSLPVAQPRPKVPAGYKQASEVFFASREWQELRYKALKLHGARCQCCGACRVDGKRMHVDHIKPRSRFPELELEISNLQILCEDCNLGKGAWDQTDWRDALSAQG